MSGYTIAFTNQFKKDAKRCVKRNYDILLLEELMVLLRTNGAVPLKYKAHLLSGNYNGYWECHIKTDWLLIWLQDDVSYDITLVRTGTHSGLF
jgi:mRNA interferase YafQ